MSLWFLKDHIHVAEFGIAMISSDVNTSVSTRVMGTFGYFALRQMSNTNLENVIVMKYYGGREISEDDLEKALLVGMSPHERKLFGNTTQEGQVSSTVEVIPSSLSSSNPDDAGELYASLRDKCSKEDVNDDMTEDTDVSSLPLCMDMDINTEVLAGDNKQTTSHENGFSYTKLISNPEGTISAKHNSKPSLLGHGSHGNQVVEHMMREYGEEGILDNFAKSGDKSLWRLSIFVFFLVGGM